MAWPIRLQNCHDKCLRDVFMFATNHEETIRLVLRIGYRHQLHDDSGQIENPFGDLSWWRWGN